MTTLSERGGGVHIRVGGNTQDYAVLVDSIPNGSIIEKLDANDIDNPTNTPPVLYTPEMFYLMSNVSSLTKIQWYLGKQFSWPLKLVFIGVVPRYSVQRYRKFEVADCGIWRQDSGGQHPWIPSR